MIYNIYTISNMAYISFIIFAIILVFYLWHAFSVVYHFIRFGIGNQPKNLALIFLAGSIILFIVAAFAYIQIDWQTLLSFKSYINPREPLQ